MKNTFGHSVRVTLFGESHGKAIGAVLDGLAPGLPVNDEYIAAQLALRRPSGRIGSTRMESDPFRIVSGVYRGYTTGTPLCLLIPNQDVKRNDYETVSHIARPGHADYTAEMKYHGYQDPSGGGHFSGRLTAPLVAVGAIVRMALRNKGISIGTHVLKCGGVADRPFNDIACDLEALEAQSFAVLDAPAGARMREAILHAADEGDSVGGLLETAVLGVPAGVGEPWFSSVESELASALFAVPAVKGVSFGAGFDFADMKGSAANDAFRIQDGKVMTETNHNGGINGGITNGMPLRYTCVIKPTPSIYKQQKTVDYRNMTVTDLQIAGRHDPAIVHRAAIVVTSVSALVLCDLLALRFGTDWLKEG